MNKSLLLAAAIAAFSMGACSFDDSSGSAAVQTKGLDSLFSRHQADSLAFTLAASAGMENNLRFSQACEHDSTLSKQQFIDGFRYGFQADTATAYRYGLYCAINLANQMEQWEQEGIAFNYTKFQDTFADFFMNDSVDTGEMARYRETLDYLNRKLNEAVRAYDLAKIEDSEPSRRNIAAGRQFIDSVANADPQVKVMASGVAIKIEKPGEGPKVEPGDRVTLVYTASTAQGHVFERTTADSARPVSVASRVNGLQQALQMLGKGGEATVYVPGKEAYGPEGSRRFGLGPNQLVIYHIYVKDIS